MTTTLITGSNTGIGAATAIALGKQGHRILFACRDESKTRPVMAQVPNSRFVKLELDDLDSVRACAKSVDEPIDVLLLNAGVARVKSVTKQGWEATFGINHLGHFLLTMLLEPLVKDRVVVVASRAHERFSGGIDYAQLQKPYASMTGWKEYEQSKFANVLFARSLEKKWPTRKVYSLHPGVIASELWRRFPWPLRPLLMSMMRSPEEGAIASIACATGNLPNGYYGENAEPRAVNPLVTDAAAEELWAFSEKAVRDWLPSP